MMVTDLPAEQPGWDLSHKHESQAVCRGKAFITFATQPKDVILSIPGIADLGLEIV